MPKNTPECTGSRLRVDAAAISEDGYATCAVCGKARKVNDDNTIRKHDGWAKGPTRAELKAVPSDSPEEESTPIPVVKPAHRERLKPEYPPLKEIGFIIGVDKTDESDLESTIDRLRNYLADGEHVKRVTFTHGKYYYEGKFYSSAEWKDLTEDAEEDATTG